MEAMQFASALHRRIGWLAIALLLVLRIPYSIVATYVSANVTGWAAALYQVATYLLIAFLIWWERDDLSIHHIDSPAIMLIVLFGPAQTLILRYWGIDTPLTFPHPAGLLIWVAATVLTLALARSAHKRAPINAMTVTWLTRGFLAGLLLVAMLNLDAFRHTEDLVPLPSVSSSTGLAFFYQMGFAAVSEEPLFRGFLWGYLRSLHWPDLRSWLAQAALFMLAHLYFINAMHFQFWVLVPAGGLIFGLFAWKSRSIGPGMFAHAAFNSGAYLILLNALAAALKWP